MMKTLSTVAPWILLLCVKRICARSWEDIKLAHDMNRPDSAGQAYLEAKERQLLNESESSKPPAPTESPSHMERLPTTNAPSPSPSFNPTNLPSVMPSVSPSFAPSRLPSSVPSALPTAFDPYPPNDPPQNPAQGYFNYDDSSKYGPKNWGSVGLPDNFYWAEFDSPGFGAWKEMLKPRSPSKNMCGDGQFQSPIDVRENGAVCDEEHEIRDKPGQYPLTGDQVQKRIEAYALRLFYPRRPCANLEDPVCQEPDPPFADFPHGWKGTGDVLHIDFKVPSEHTILGVRFDAEMQIYHISPSRNLVPVLSTLIRAQTGGYNYYLQEALDAFQRKYDENHAKCAVHLRHGRQLVSDFHGMIGANVTSPLVDYATWADFSTRVDHPEVTHHDRERELQFPSGVVWNPYHVMLIPTIYFYRYEGSLTEPPCGEFVSWWISDKQMIMSFEQLEQMKKIQFTNVDSNCKKTSAHFDRSVARPIQPTNDRPVWKCTPVNFVADPPLPVI